MRREEAMKKADQPYNILWKLAVPDSAACESSKKEIPIMKYHILSMTAMTASVIQWKPVKYIGSKKPYFTYGQYLKREIPTDNHRHSEAWLITQYSGIEAICRTVCVEKEMALYRKPIIL